ncbi:unnamed protein product [Paramecium primaurelia]|uniref:Protein kinase domain-containing protein n=1 Tax=Paramecium primaurelia TaxID=5886 RepID=A0A8S1PCN6_PARPR|nr:unnamed protein product [Paramecium primaurelia]
MQNQNYQVLKLVGDNYEILVKVLGQGQYAMTYLARNKLTQKYLACKNLLFLNLIKLKANKLQNIDFKELHRDYQVNCQIHKLLYILILLNSKIQLKVKKIFTFLWNYVLEEPQKNQFGIKKDQVYQMPYLSLNNWLKIIFIFQLLGCGYLYEKNIIHRDLKPSNVLLQDNQIKIADFGLSKALEEQIKEMANDNTPQIGTPLYMSPQVIGQQNYSIKSDVWSLGCIFYEMLYGKTPWYHDDISILQQMIQNENVQFPNDVEVSEKIKILITKMLSKTEKDRLNINQVIAQLEEI